MKVFLGWSGAKSHRVAVALHDWLPKVIQSVKPYISSEDIAKGARWGNDIAQELQDSRFGIIVVTRENATTPWINFEAGALSKEIEKSSVAPFLVDIKPTELLGKPLAFFQQVENNEADILKLLESINNKQEPDRQLPKPTLKEVFDKWWDTLELELTTIEKESGTAKTAPKRDAVELLEELLSRIQVHERRVEDGIYTIRNEYEISNLDLLSEVKKLAILVNSLGRNIESILPSPPPLNNLAAMLRTRSNVKADLTLLGKAGEEAFRNAFAEAQKPNSQSENENG